MNSEPCSTEIRQEKHIALDEAIGFIQYVEEQLRGLRDRLHPTPSAEVNGCCVESVKRSPPCFVDVLDAAPERITDKCNSLQELIDQIEGLLF